MEDGLSQLIEQVGYEEESQDVMESIMIVMGMWMRLIRPLSDAQDGVCEGIKVCAGAEGWINPDYEQIFS